jgi:hypothetical protein
MKSIHSEGDGGHNPNLKKVTKFKTGTPQIQVRNAPT